MLHRFRQINLNLGNTGTISWFVVKGEISGVVSRIISGDMGVLNGFIDTRQ